MLALTLAFLGIAVLTPLLATKAYSASSWNPTLLVNTEAFQRIDDSDSSSDVKITFGESLNKNLKYERTAGRFSFDDDLLVQGDAEIVGIGSGIHLHAQDLLTSSGQLIVESRTAYSTGSLVLEQRVTGTGMYIFTTATGAPLVVIDTYAGPSTTTGGTTRSPGILFGYRGTFDVRMYRSHTGSLSLGSDTGVTLRLQSHMKSEEDIFRIYSDYTFSGNLIFKVRADGNVFADGIFTGLGADFAEYFYSSEPAIPLGTIITVDTNKAGHVRTARSSFDPLLGVISTSPAFAAGGQRLEQGRTERTKDSSAVLVGLTGIVPTRVIAENASIQIGDPITVSSSPGVGRKAKPEEDTIGYALEHYNGSAEGMIEMFVGPRTGTRTSPLDSSLLFGNTLSDALFLRPPALSSPPFLADTNVLYVQENRIVIRGTHHLLSTKRLVGQDELHVIEKGTIGQMLLLRTVDVGTSIRIVDSPSLHLNGDFILSHPDDAITLVKIAENVWIELQRSDNG